jgi:hypothetical protein
VAGLAEPADDLALAVRLLRVAGDSSGDDDEASALVRTSGGFSSPYLQRANTSHHITHTHTIYTRHTESKKVKKIGLLRDGEQRGR